jgi:hypothetical protein
MTLEIKHTFDDKNYRHYMNGFNVVLHCHHYMSLTTKLAIEYDDIGGTKILAESAEDSVLPLLAEYIKSHNISDPKERLNVGADFYKEMGMGVMDISGTEQGGKAVLTSSHVDKGWQTKWGPTNRAVNYFTAGYVAAAFEAAFNKPARSYAIKEQESMMTGSKTSSFTVEIVKGV